MACSRNFDSDYDAMQPYYFLDGEEDLLLGPGEDIWKNNEPLSPSHPSSATAFDLMDQDCPSSVLLQSFIIHDCMWSSSFPAAAKLENAVSQMLLSLRAHGDSDSSTTNMAGHSQGRIPQVKTSHSLDFPMPTLVCINPSEVLPYSMLCGRSRDVSEGAEVNIGPSEREPVENDEVDRKPLSDVNIQQHSYASEQPRISIADTHSAPSHSTFPRYCSRSKDKQKSQYMREHQSRKELKRSFKAHNHRCSKAPILENATELITTVQADKKKLVARKEELMPGRRLKHRLK
uniref:transcriptional regulator Myc-A-like isoform X2 n=1 Tax=Doryrhamphus excisus TaxID=161450 RepID=UPI0025ADAC1A|nr:transcriptional regulator Myc-A-like isoform X2 [Doryrhamphus excisus]